MKIRLYPKTTTVIAMVKRAIEHEEQTLKEAEDKLSELANSRLYTGDDGHRWKMAKQSAEDNISELRAKIEVLRDHDPPEVTAEIEI